MPQGDWPTFRGDCILGHVLPKPVPHLTLKQSPAGEGQVLFLTWFKENVEKLTYAEGPGSSRVVLLQGVVTREDETRNAAADQSEARLKIWCFYTAFLAVPYNFQSKHSLPSPRATFLCGGGKCAGHRRNDIPSLQKFLSPALPSHPLVLADNSFKGFPCYPSSYLFIYFSVAEIGTTDWATAGCIGKVLSGCFLGVQRISGRTARPEKTKPWHLQ